MCMVAGNLALSGVLIYKLYQTAAKFTELENALGALFHSLFEKLEKFEKIMPESDPISPIMQIIQGMVDNNTSKDRDDGGQFVKARIIEPKKE